MRADRPLLWRASFAYVLLEAPPRINLSHTRFAATTRGPIASRPPRSALPEDEPVRILEKRRAHGPPDALQDVGLEVSAVFS
jgi:hypothetical protein